MNTPPLKMKGGPYNSFPDDTAIVNRLVTIKEASETTGCADSTLRNNARARRLPAYQRGNGTPVYVLLCEVEEFLRDRPDIRSNLHRDPEVNGPTNRTETPALETLPPGVGLPLRCLNGVSPETINLLSRCLVEVAEAIQEFPKPNGGSESPVP